MPKKLLRPPAVRLGGPSPDHPRLEPGFTPPDVRRILFDAEIDLGAAAEAWAATWNPYTYRDPETGEVFTYDRDCVECLADSLTDAAYLLVFQWRIQQLEKPSAREAWAREVERRALALLEVLEVAGTDIPVEPPKGAFETLAAFHDEHDDPYTAELEFLRRMQPDFVGACGDAKDEQLGALLLRVTEGRTPCPGVMGYPSHMIAAKNALPILVDGIRMATVGVQLLARRAVATAEAARAQRTGKKVPDRAFLDFVRQVVSLYRSVSGKEATVRTDSNPIGGRHIRTWSPALAFYQSTAKRLLELLPQPVEVPSRMWWEIGVA